MICELYSQSENNTKIRWIAIRPNKHTTNLDCASNLPWWSQYYEYYVVDVIYDFSAVCIAVSYVIPLVRFILWFCGDSQNAEENGEAQALSSSVNRDGPTAEHARDRSEDKDGRHVSLETTSKCGVYRVIYLLLVGLRLPVFVTIGLLHLYLIPSLVVDHPPQSIRNAEQLEVISISIAFLADSVLAPHEMLKLFHW
jgi:hypothetical protein